MVAVMVATPGACPVTVPTVSTVAIAGSLLVHDALRSRIRPLAALAVTAIWITPPTTPRTPCGANSTVATGGGRMTETRTVSTSAVSGVVRLATTLATPELPAMRNRAGASASLLPHTRLATDGSLEDKLGTG